MRLYMSVNMYDALFYHIHRIGLITFDGKDWMGLIGWDIEGLTGLIGWDIEGLTGLMDRFV